MDTTIKNMRSAGVTIIELLIAIAVGSVVILMLMQMIVMNVTAQQRYEYENYVTSESLLITEYIRRNLNDLQPHRVDIVTAPNGDITVTFTHEYDIVIDNGTGALLKSEANASSDVLFYSVANETLTYNGTLLHASKVKIISGTTISVDYYEDVDPDPLTCSDVSEPSDRYICGDGIVELVLLITVEFDAGRGDEYTFTTRIIV